MTLNNSPFRTPSTNFRTIKNTSCFAVPCPPCPPCPPAGAPRGRHPGAVWIEEDVWGQTALCPGHVFSRPQDAHDLRRWLCSNPPGDPVLGLLRFAAFTMIAIAVGCWQLSIVEVDHVNIMAITVEVDHVFFFRICQHNCQKMVLMLVNSAYEINIHIAVSVRGSKAGKVKSICDYSVITWYLIFCDFRGAIHKH